MSFTLYEFDRLIDSLAHRERCSIFWPLILLHTRRSTTDVDGIKNEQMKRHLQLHGSLQEQLPATHCDRCERDLPGGGRHGWRQPRRTWRRAGREAASSAR